ERDYRRETAELGHPGVHVRRRPAPRGQSLHVQRRHPAAAGSHGGPQRKGALMTMPGHWPVGGGRSVLASGTTRAALRRIVREELAKLAVGELGAETPDGAQDKVDAAVAMLRSELQASQQQDADRYAQKYIEAVIASGRLSQAAITSLIDGRVDSGLGGQVLGGQVLGDRLVLTR